MLRELIETIYRSSPDVKTAPALTTQQFWDLREEITKTNYNPVIFGPPGSGKTRLVQALYRFLSATPMLTAFITGKEFEELAPSTDACAALLGTRTMPGTEDPVGDFEYLRRGQRGSDRLLILVDGLDDIVSPQKRTWAEDFLARIQSSALSPSKEHEQRHRDYVTGLGVRPNALLVLASRSDSFQDAQLKWWVDSANPIRLEPLEQPKLATPNEASQYAQAYFDYAGFDNTAAEEAIRLLCAKVELNQEERRASLPGPRILVGNPLMGTLYEKGVVWRDYERHGHGFGVDFRIASACGMLR